MYNLKKGNRGKAVFQHKFLRHNLMLEAVCPGLFMEKKGTYWDVPLSMSVDLNSAFSSIVNYHLCLQHNSGQPKHFGCNYTSEVPMSLLPGLCAKAAISFKKHIEFWRKKEGMLKLVQPYDVFLSNPQICGVGIIGAVTSLSLGENSMRFSVRERLQTCNSSELCFHKNKFALFCDLFATVSFKAQFGNFQRLFLDLTKFDACLEFPSGSKFVSGAASLVSNYYYSQKPDATAIHAICPNVRVSLQQQVVGPISFRFDSGILLDSNDNCYSARLDDSVFAIDWALKVLGSAKASLWFSPKRQEGMVELRFFES
ncbi:hypothetical protein AXF42_Ash016091 [Apostasia shenzhenica]|uniref:Uncharacterized protein n=1 Tax=Apostasia shenzhenica TaxID=1088818 RepID=A0A2I0B3D5_9ASPA|nr:hypothetical protein AXF42_Ash016091 [Apostasia shenzhenica]